MSAHQKNRCLEFKTQYGLGFNPQDDEIVVEFFCGGGAGTGLEMGMGRPVAVAKNHNPAALSMHTARLQAEKLSEMIDGGAAASIPGAGGVQEETECHTKERIRHFGGSASLNQMEKELDALLALPTTRRRKP